MKTGKLGTHGPKITECGLGCWQLGGGWGNPWDNAVAQEILTASYDSGVRFFDTADVYGNGESERSVGMFRKSHPDIIVATKLGRAGIFPDGYSRSSLREATEKSLKRLGVGKIDVTQLHCVPMEILREGAVFDWLREQQDDGLIERFGASVETVEEGLICLEQEGLTSLQVIFNIFRQKPLKELFVKAQEKGVGIIVRLPLASGLLSGKMTKETSFREGDHRNFNRDGQSFNVGETFAGIKYEKGVELADQLKAMVPENMTMVQMALRWILDYDAVSTVIPGASRPSQARENARISDMPPLSAELHERLSIFYEKEVHEHVRGPY
ncbi:MAG: aldo/keto reductase [Chitinivibrionales bacterium]|nr:aldo/keto reductase [Chitinivibrionales bacterium]